MKKIFLFGVIAFNLSCSNNPKCNDEEVVKKVTEMKTFYKTNLFKNNSGILIEKFADFEASKIFAEYYKEKVKNSSDKYGKSCYDCEFEFENDKDYIALCSNFKDFIKHKPVNVSEDLKLIFKKHTDSIFVPSLTNITTNFEDTNSQSCGCSGDLTFDIPKNIDNHIKVNYVAQKNSEGQVNIEIIKN